MHRNGKGGGRLPASCEHLSLSDGWMVSPAVHTSLAAVLLNWRFVERAGNKTQQDEEGGGKERERETENAVCLNTYLVALRLLKERKHFGDQII